MAAPFPLTLVSIVAFTTLAAQTRAADAVDFSRDVKPILEKSCVECHGPDKQKGKLRLDSATALRKGGDNGAEFDPAKPDESEIMRRVTLPETDDDVMPPKGKAPHLTAAQADTLKRWIAAGAPWPDGVVAVAAKESSGASAAGPAASPGELAARADLIKRGVHVRPIAAQVNWTLATFLSAPKDLPVEAYAKLSQLATLQKLDLSNSNVTDETLANVSKLTNLTKLNLSHTATSDAGLDHLKGLDRLETLNLFGTKVTDAGLAKLSELKGLKQVYLAESKVTPAGAAKLRKARSGLRVDDGEEFAELIKVEPVAAKPAAGAPKPAASTPKPAASTPKPAAATPKPVAATPKPVAATPKPAAATPKPAAATPKPAAATPKPDASAGNTGVDAQKTAK